MAMREKSCAEFVRVLASKEPVPGGGGASALVGAIGMALGSMVGSLTTGKKKYADVQADIEDLMQRAAKIQNEMLELIDRDAEAFYPLSQAYGLPKETEEQRAEKARALEQASKDACTVPLEIMEKACEAIDILEEFAAKGSRLAVSDAGVGVAFCRSALLGASLNVFINTKTMQDREYAESLNARAEQMIAEYGAKADRIFTSVRSQF